MKPLSGSTKDLKIQFSISIEILCKPKDTFHDWLATFDKSIEISLRKQLRGMKSFKPTC